MRKEAHQSKTKFLNAAMRMFRERGYEAATIEDVCATAGLTKGSFFHHFGSKEELALAAAQHFAEMAEGLFARASYRAFDDPLARVLGYIDFRREILLGELPEFTCLLGMLVQETYATREAIRQVCDRYISEHAATLVADIEAAKQEHCPGASWSPDSLALYTQAVLQGAFVLAKAKNGPEVASDCVGHLRHYFELLFQPGQGGDRREKM